MFQKYSDYDNVIHNVWLYNSFFDSSAILSLVIISTSLAVSLHWGIRHFNYSPQRYQYNTLPVSPIQKLGFICTYAFIILPVLHILIVGGVFLLTSKVSVMTVFSKTSWELLLDVILNIKADIEKWFFLAHLHIFIALYILLSLFFNKMGFIKTAIAVFAVAIIGAMFFHFLNVELWEKQGGFATVHSMDHFPSLYMLHYVCTTVLFIGTLYIIYTRLVDKNY